MQNKYHNRVLVSFDERCPMKCKHCYTYELVPKTSFRTTEQLVQDIEGTEFDVIYISQSYENFADEKKGLELCRKLYETYKRDIFIITRSALGSGTLSGLKQLNEEMDSNGNKLFLAVSVCADNSYGITEDIDRCPQPQQRLDNLEQAHGYKIRTILLLRPIFPDKIIPVEECIKLVKMSKSYIDAVVSSGLIVTDTITKNLQINLEDVKWSVDGDSEYLKDLDKTKTKYLDVENELKNIQDYCTSISVPFFRHSLPALNYLA